MAVSPSRAVFLGRAKLFRTMREAAIGLPFPTTADGVVADTPQRGVISLYSEGGIMSYAGSSSSDGSSNGLVGQLSTKQAALYREAGIIAADAIKILGGLETFTPEADVEE